MKRIFTILACFCVLAACGEESVVRRIMLDDFSDVSSWLGGASANGAPGAVSPFDFNFGSEPDERRDDGYAGVLRFDFGASEGKAGFSKNAVYKTLLPEGTLRFSADTAGKAGFALSFTLEDAQRNRFETRKLGLAGAGWSDYVLELSPGTVSGYERMVFPVSVYSLNLYAHDAGRGEVKIDDIFFETATPGGDALHIRPDFDRMAYAPGETVMLTYRLRNLFPERTFDGVLELKVGDSEGRELLTRRNAVHLAPGEFKRISFDLGAFAQRGGYSCELRLISNCRIVQRHLGWVGVFEPNDGRINRTPMWISVEDQEVNTAPYEATFHAQWVKLLGADMIRAAILGGIAEPTREHRNYEKFRRMWQPYLDGGIMLQIDYAAAVAPWTIPAENRKGPWPNTLACDWELFSEHIRNLASFLKTLPQARYFEWYNEPDLGGYQGSAEDYFHSLSLLYPILKEAVPDLKVTTGGVTLGVPHAKKGFVETLYVKCAPSYDLAAFHEHGGFSTYRATVEAVKKLLPAGKSFGQTEAGVRSYQGKAEQFYFQAGELIRKIAWTKAAGGEFYNYFMLQDYWDKYINADDSFGLVTVDNQPKPAFVTMNEVIRRLANRRPAGLAELDSRLEGVRFVGEDGQELFVLWNRGGSGAFQFPVRSDSDAAVTRIDAFGNETRIEGGSGLLFIPGSSLPFYLSAPAGSLKPAGELVAWQEPLLGAPGETANGKMILGNPYTMSVAFRLIAAGEIHTGTLAPGAKTIIPLRREIPLSARPGMRELPVTLVFREAKDGGKKLYEGEVSLQYEVALPLRRNGGDDGAKPDILLDSESALMELIFDPTVPRWAGAADLAAEISLSWDETGLRFDVEVRDQDHCAPESGIMNWRNDGLQLAFSDGAGGNHVELTVSDGPDGAQAYCHISPDAGRIGVCRLPRNEISRTPDGRTKYAFTLPWELCRLSPESGAAFRMALAVVDNDQRQRRRIMTFGGGIEGSKNPALFLPVKLMDSKGGLK